MAARTPVWHQRKIGTIFGNGFTLRINPDAGMTFRDKVSFGRNPGDHAQTKYRESKRFDLNITRLDGPAACQLGPAPISEAHIFISRRSSGVEHPLRKRVVGGSNPSAGTNFNSVRPGEIGNRAYLRHG
jgi:hypothetical protein